MSLDLFDLQAPKCLFFEIQKAFEEYCEQPNSRLFLFLVFSLNHLQEWIAKSSDKGAVAQKGFSEIIEFEVIRDLCNRSKHHKVAIKNKTTITVGFHCNSGCTDSLDQMYYLVDGVDSRNIFSVAIREYAHWFRNDGE